MPSLALLIFGHSEDSAAVSVLTPTTHDRSEDAAAASPATITNTSVPQPKTTKDPEMHPLERSRRLGPYGLAFLAIVGFVVFVIYFVISFRGEGKLYEYSCPFSAMWVGLATMWYCVVLLSWWLLSKSKSRIILKVWMAISLFVAIQGFISLISFASSKNEGTAAGFSMLLIVSGSLGSMMCLAEIKQAANDADTLAPLGCNDTEPKAEGRCAKCSVCCTAKFWLNFCAIFVMLWGLVFSGGVMVQSTAASADYNTFKPPGSIHTITSNGVELQLHLFCFGAATAGKKTIIFEHGGGSNSVSMLALAEEVTSKHKTRACVYDRLGYGFSPSYYTGLETLENSGVLLSKLLAAAGETGPFVCAGHSAGAEACLWFAHEQHDVTGVAMLDGYPDLIRAGAFRPGKEPNKAILQGIQALAVMAGAPGMARGAIGNPGAEFVPAEEKGTMIALYAQTRFWFAQYWDVAADFAREEDQRLYKQLGGSKDSEGLVRYGGTLQGVKVLVVPAAWTTNRTCEGEENAKQFCCGRARDSNRCVKEFADSRKYQEQAMLYAETLSDDVEGKVVFGPEGSFHNFVYHQDYYQWIAARIIEHLL
eukprot:CAMPEP_0181329804 /NCGR_PEP_ID=MMETSP1101-20121128/23525_1 /TAXON_ID=46948 /ORGANISM="Rhodomonas abbreviata, Strain Caron Lab Isolate" /LENGTH=591 /DNA_ID=CAMNT_0023438945 /DNA_START=47 /DNA_END=1822 /DNA_ORIENTATION=-